MAKFKANLPFRGIAEEKNYPADKKFDMTIKRAEEVQENIRKQAENDEIDEDYKTFELTRTDKE